jgi:hypothetical protein
MVLDESHKEPAQDSHNTAAPAGHEINPHMSIQLVSGDTMSNTSDADERTVACPACDSPNTIQIAARGLQYQYRDCNTEFDSGAGPMDLELG